VVVRTIKLQPASRTTALINDTEKAIWPNQRNLMMDSAFPLITGFK